MRTYGGWTSINYFVFPGLTDSIEEYEALRRLINETGLCMIQWRNFNIDPDWYMGKIGITETGECLGIKQMMKLIREEFPDLKFGYFNPSMERIRGIMKWILHTNKKEATPLKDIHQSRIAYLKYSFHTTVLPILTAYFAASNIFITISLFAGAERS